MLTELAVTLASQVPVAGALANQVVRRAFITSANATLNRDIVEWSQELDRRDLVGRVRDSVEVLLDSVVTQLTRSLYRASEEGAERVASEVAGVRQELAGLHALLNDRFVQGFVDAMRAGRPDNTAASPFWAGPAIGPAPGHAEYFAGRERQLSELAQALARYQPVQVLGATRMGKTSLLERALAMIPRDMNPVRLNMHGTEGYSSRELVLAMADKLGRYRDVEARLQRATAGDEQGLAVLQALEMLTPLAVLFDEADVLARSARDFDEGFLNHCRSLGQARRLLWISVSQNDLETQLQERGVASRFLNDSKRIYVGQLRDDEARSMVQVLGPSRAERALQTAGGFAYGLQWLGHEWWLEPERAGMEDHFANAMSAAFDNWWRSVDDRARTLLRRLVQPTSVSDLAGKERRLARALELRGLVCEHDERFSLPGQAWREFVADAP